MTQPVKTQEPSMEEILASIRRIISDDETKPAAVQAAPPKAAPEPPKAEPARAAPKAVPPAAAAQPRSKPAAPSPSSQESQPAPKPSAPSPESPVANNSQGDIDAMLAGLDAETSEVRTADPEDDGDVFELTEQMTIAEEPPVPAQPAVPVQQVAEQYTAESSEPESRPLMSPSTMVSVESAFNTLANTVLSNNARTLEDLVKEMLRPMLRSWLDDNLPNMVERIVRAEIERVSRGR